MATKKQVLTQEEYDKLQKEYRHIIDVEQPKVTADLELARSQGDLSENADYSAARDHQSQLASRVLELEAIFNNHEIVKKDKNANGSISIGNIVKFSILPSGELMSVKIAGSTGADPMAKIPTISNESPLAKAMLGKVPGDEVRVEVDEPYSIRIVEKILEKA